MFAARNYEPIIMPFILALIVLVVVGIYVYAHRTFNSMDIPARGTHYVYAQDVYEGMCFLSNGVTWSIVNVHVYKRGNVRLHCVDTATNARTIMRYSTKDRLEVLS